jgi:hypothetical protein
VLEHDLGAEARGLLLELLHHLRAHHAVGITGIVLDLGRDRQLSAGLHAFEEQRRQSARARVDRAV